MSTSIQKIGGRVIADLLTDGGTGPNRRLRVDIGQTSFFGGRDFRSFKEFSLTAASTYVVKVVTLGNVILNDLSISLISGEVKLYTKTGGTEGGTFSETLPIIGRNTMTERPTPYYTAKTVLTAGGTLTGGTSIDLVWAKTAGNSNFSSNIGKDIDSERGIPAGTYYFVLQAISNSTGVFSTHWEERV